MIKLIDEGNIEAAKAAVNELFNLLGENNTKVVYSNTLIEANSDLLP